MTAILCRIGIHTPGRYLNISNGRYVLICKRCGKETT